MKELVVEYKGKSVSLNQMYAGSWRARHARVISYHAIFHGLLRGIKKPKFDQFSVTLHYNSKFDVDNNSALTKIFVDVLRAEGIVYDDNSKYFKKLTIKFSPELENNTYKFLVQEYKVK